MSVNPGEVLPMHSVNEPEDAVDDVVIDARGGESTRRRSVPNLDRVVADPGFSPSGLTALSYPRLGIPDGVNGKSDAVYETVISLSENPWLADHRLGERAILPGTAVADLVRAAAEKHLGSVPEIRGLVFISPIVLQDMVATHVRVMIAKSGSTVSVHCRASAAPEANWVRCAVAHVSRQMAGPTKVDIKPLRTRCNKRADVGSLYRDLAATGIVYGSAFRRLRQLDCGANEALGLIELQEDQDPRGYGMHPALLDAALHVVAGAAPAGRYEARIPFEVGRFTLYETNRREALVHAQRVDGGAAIPLVNICVMNLDGAVIAVMSSIYMRRADGLTSPHRSRRAPSPQISSRKSK